MTAFTEKNAYNEVTKSTYGKLTVIDKGLYTYEHGQNHDKWLKRIITEKGVILNSFLRFFFIYQTFSKIFFYNKQNPDFHLYFLSFNLCAVYVVIYFTATWWNYDGH